MQYTKKTTIIIPEIKWEAIGDWIISRFLEQFGNDKLIQEYLDSWRKKFNMQEYVLLATWDVSWIYTWVISIADYQEFLDTIRARLPKKYRKIWTPWKPWFKNVTPMVDLMMWPITFEAATLHWQKVANK